MVECSVADPEPDWIRIQSSQWIRIFYGGLRISYLKLLKKNKYKKSSAVNFFNFLDIKSLEPDLYSAKRLAPDPESMNPDPQHWLNELPKNCKKRYPVAR
jgi:hypothetical protein